MLGFPEKWPFFLVTGAAGFLRFYKGSYMVYNGHYQGSSEALW